MKVKRLIVIMVVIIGIIGIALLIVFKSHNEQLKLESSDSQVTLKHSPYTLEEMYNFTKEGSWPKDSIAVIEDWYSYFSKDTPFINSHGEELTYEEYTAVKNGVDGNFFYKITGLTKDFFNGKYY